MKKTKLDSPVKRQGRRKHQPIKQYSPESGKREKNLLLAFFGEHADSYVYHLAHECVAILPLIPKLGRISAKAPDIADNLRAQLESLFQKVGRFVVNSDIKALQKFVNAYKAVTEQQGKLADPTRLAILGAHAQLSAALQRRPTTRELRNAAANSQAALLEMDTSQFARTYKGLGLETTNQNTWNSFCTIYRKLKKATRDNLTQEDFFTAIQKTKLCPVDITLEDISAICLANGMRFSDVEKG